MLNNMQDHIHLPSNMVNFLQSIFWRVSHFVAVFEEMDGVFYLWVRLWNINWILRLNVFQIHRRGLVQTLIRFPIRRTYKWHMTKCKEVTTDADYLKN